MKFQLLVPAIYLVALMGCNASVPTQERCVQVNSTGGWPESVLVMVGLDPLSSNGLNVFVFTEAKVISAKFEMSVDGRVRNVTLENHEFGGELRCYKLSAPEFRDTIKGKTSSECLAAIKSGVVVRNFVGLIK